MLDLGFEEDVVILDDMETPYMIKNVKEFLDKIFSIYMEGSNSYYQNFSNLLKKRTVEKLIGD